MCRRYKRARNPTYISPALKADHEKAIRAGLSPTQVGLRVFVAATSVAIFAPLPLLGEGLG